MDPTFFSEREGYDKPATKKEIMRRENANLHLNHSKVLYPPFLLIITILPFILTDEIINVNKKKEFFCYNSSFFISLNGFMIKMLSIRPLS